MKNVEFHYLLWVYYFGFCRNNKKQPNNHFLSCFFLGFCWDVWWMVCGSGKRVTRELTQKCVNLCKTLRLLSAFRSLHLFHCAIFPFEPPSTTEWLEIYAESFELCWVIWWFAGVERAKLFFWFTVQMIKVKSWSLTFIYLELFWFSSVYLFLN